MAATAIPSPSTRCAFFGDHDFVSARVEELAHLSEINERILSIIEREFRDVSESAVELLPKRIAKRQEILGSMKALADQSDLSADDLKKKLNGIGSRLGSVYFPKGSTNDSKAVSARIRQDLVSLQTSPIVRSYDGVNGPTVLVTYPFLSDSSPRLEIRTGVIKWTNWTEVVCNHLYRFFSDRFLVPENTAYDLKGRIAMQVHGDTVRMADPVAKKMETEFDRLKKVFPLEVDDDEPATDNEQVQISERLPGEHLFDFATTKYQYLNEAQKREVFASIASIAVRDVILGHTDRFAIIEFDDDSEQYEFAEDRGSNIGNAMFVWQKGESNSPKAYAIDNGLDTEVMEDDEQNQAYISFLRKKLKSPEFSKALTDNIISNIRTGFQVEGFRLEPEDLANYKKFLAVFEKDLIHNGKAVMPSVIEETLQKMKAAAKSFDRDGQAVKTMLRSHTPQLLTAVKQRLAVLS